MAEEEKKIVDQNNSGLDDRVERKVEIFYSAAGIIVGGAVSIIGALKGDTAMVWPGVTLVAISFALFQGTSIAKIRKF